MYLASAFDQTKAQPTQMVFALMLMHVCFEVALIQNILPLFLEFAIKLGVTEILFLVFLFCTVLTFKEKW